MKRLLNIMWNQALFKVIGHKTPQQDFTSSGVTLVTLITLAVFTAAFVVLTQVIGEDSLHNWVVQAGPWAPIVYVALKASTFIVAPLNGAALKVASGALFGIWGGVFYSTLGDLVGGSINFWITRLLGRKIIARLFGNNGLARVDDFSRRLGGWRALLLAQVFLRAIYDLVSYAVGLTSLPFYQYLAVSVIGGLAMSIFWVSLGVGLAEEPTIFLVVSSALVVFYLIIILLRIQRVRRNRSSS